MKLEKFKKEIINDKNILSAIKGGANGMSVNREATSYQQFYESTCEEWCMDMQVQGYEDGNYMSTLKFASTTDCL